MNKKQDHFIINIFRGVRHRLKRLSHVSTNKVGLTWYRTKQLKHLPYNSPHTYKLLGATIHFNNGPELLHSLHEIFLDDIYKIPFLSPQPYIIDCGANIGLSVIYIKTQNPGARIIAFEPDPANFGLLQRNVSAFGWQDIKLCNEAIWKDNTTLEFISDGTLGSKLSSESQANNKVQVKATRLKDYLKEKVDFLKIDIEGAEYEVLLDCAEDLKMVDYLFIEFHGFFNKMYQLTNILQLVQDNGFVYYIKEASNVYPVPFFRKDMERPYDIQQNIFCFRIQKTL